MLTILCDFAQMTQSVFAALMTQIVALVKNRLLFVIYFETLLDINRSNGVAIRACMDSHFDDVCITLAHLAIAHKYCSDGIGL